MSIREEHGCAYVYAFNVCSAAHPQLHPHPDQADETLEQRSIRPCSKSFSDLAEKKEASGVSTDQHIQRLGDLLEFGEDGNMRAKDGYSIGSACGCGKGSATCR